MTRQDSIYSGVSVHLSSPCSSPSLFSPLHSSSRPCPPFLSLFLSSPLSFKNQHYVFQTTHTFSAHNLSSMWQCLYQCLEWYKWVLNELIPLSHSYSLSLSLRLEGIMCRDCTSLHNSHDSGISVLNYCHLWDKFVNTHLSHCSLTYTLITLHVVTDRSVNGTDSTDRQSDRSRRKRTCESSVKSSCVLARTSSDCRQERTSAPRKPACPSAESDT